MSFSLNIVSISIITIFVVITPSLCDIFAPNSVSIVAGNNASIKDFPYQVSLYLGTGNENDKFYCGGSIISENYILTAAHCLFNGRTNNLIVRAGSELKTKGIIIPIAKVIPHPDFGDSMYKNDIGLLKTVKPMTFTDEIKAVKLPNENEVLEEGSTVVISGWGQIGAKKLPSDNLLAAKVQVSNFDKCREVYHRHDHIVINEDVFCAGGDGVSGVCMDDGGGPAVQDGKLVGVISFFKPCAVVGRPDVYVNVAAPNIRGFISKNTGL